MARIAGVADPKNGQEFFSVLYGIDWGSKGKLVTEDKLGYLCASAVSPAK